MYNCENKSYIYRQRPGPALKAGRSLVPCMTDEELREAVESFVDDVDLALSEYEQGYADADATLTVVQSHLADLRDELE